MIKREACKPIETWNSCAVHVRWDLDVMGYKFYQSYWTLLLYYDFILNYCRWKDGLNTDKKMHKVEVKLIKFFKLHSYPRSKINLSRHSRA